MSQLLIAIAIAFTASTANANANNGPAFIDVSKPVLVDGSQQTVVDSQGNPVRLNPEPDYCQECYAGGA